MTLEQLQELFGLEWVDYVEYILEQDEYFDYLEALQKDD
jgi:hypothetical protein